MTATRPYSGYILDTCVLEFLMDKNIVDAVSAQISAWTGAAKLSISEISYAELINGAYKDKIERIKKLLYTYTGFEVSQKILSRSAIFANVYKAQHSKTSGASLPDRIIAATSFSYNQPVITADVLDFPHPFFRSQSSADILYTVKNKPRYVTIDVLVPNFTQLNYWYNQTP